MLPQWPCEAIGWWPLNFCRCPMESKGEEIIASMATGGGECHFGSGFGLQGYQPVAFAQVQGRDEAGPPQLLHKVIYLGEGVAIKLLVERLVTRTSLPSLLYILYWHKSTCFLVWVYLSNAKSFLKCCFFPTFLDYHGETTPSQLND